MEHVLVPLGFFALVFGAPLLRREMQHRHLLEKLRLEHTLAQAAPTGAQSTPDDASALALRLPEPHRLYALALLCRLHDADTASLDARSAFIVRQARSDYLPGTLRAYLNLSAPARAQLQAQGHNPETTLQEQLELISRGVDEALRQDYAAAQRVLTQGAFLRQVFADEPVPTEIRG